MADITVLPDGRIVLATCPSFALTATDAIAELIKRHLDPWIAADLIAQAKRLP